MREELDKLTEKFPNLETAHIDILRSNDEVNNLVKHSDLVIR